MENEADVLDDITEVRADLPSLSDKLPPAFFNDHLVLSDQYSLIGAIAKTVTEHPELQSLLWDFVDKSRGLKASDENPDGDLICLFSTYYPKEAIAAANAITVLNYARVSMAAVKLEDYGIRHLDYICIPGADLSFSILSNARARHADFTGVQLLNAYTKGLDLQFTILRLIDTGIVSEISIPTRDMGNNKFEDVFCLFSSSSKFLLTTRSQGNLAIYLTKTGELIKRFDMPEARVACFSHDEEKIAVAGTKKHIYIFNLRTFKLEHTFTTDSCKLSGLCFSRDGKILAGGNKAGEIYLFSMLSKELINLIKLSQGACLSLDISPDSSLLAVGTSDPAVLVWKLDTISHSTTTHIQPMKRFSFPSKYRNHFDGDTLPLKFSADNMKLAVGKGPNLYFFSVTNGWLSNYTRRYGEGRNSLICRSCTFTSPHNGWGIVTGQGDSVLRVSVTGNHYRGRLAYDDGEPHYLLPLSRTTSESHLSDSCHRYNYVSEDANLIARVKLDKVLITKLSSNKLSSFSKKIFFNGSKETFFNPGQYFGQISNSSIIAFYHYHSNLLRFFDLGKGSWTKRYKCKPDSIAFAPNGKIIAFVHDYRIHIAPLAAINTNKYVPLQNFKHVKHGVQRIIFSTDNALIACAEHHQVSVWYVKTGELLFSFSLEHVKSFTIILSMAFSSDNKKFVTLLKTCGREKKLIIWDIENTFSVELVRKLGFSSRFHRTISKIDQTTSEVAFTCNNGALLCLRGYDGAVDVRDPNNGKLIKTWSTLTFINHKLAFRNGKVDPLAKTDKYLSDVEILSHSLDQSYNLDLNNARLPSKKVTRIDVNFNNNGFFIAGYYDEHDTNNSVLWFIRENSAQLVHAFQPLPFNVVGVDISNTIGLSSQQRKLLLSLGAQDKALESSPVDVVEHQSQSELLERVSDLNSNNGREQSKTETKGSAVRQEARDEGKKSTQLVRRRQTKGASKKASSSLPQVQQDERLVFDIGNNIELAPIYLMLNKYIADDHPLHGEDAVCYMPCSSVLTYQNGDANEEITVAINSTKALKAGQMRLMIIHIEKPGEQDTSNTDSHFTLLAIRRTTQGELVAVYADSNGDFNKSAKYAKYFCDENNVAWHCLDAKAVDPSRHADHPGYQFANDCGLHVYENGKILLDASDDEFNEEYLMVRIKEIGLHDMNVAIRHRLAFAELVEQETNLDPKITKELRFAANADDFAALQQYLLSSLVDDIADLPDLFSSTSERDNQSQQHRRTDNNSGLRNQSSHDRSTSSSHTHVQRRLSGNSNNGILNAEELRDIFSSLQKLLTKVVEQTRSLNDCRAYMSSQIRHLENALDNNAPNDGTLKPKRQLKALLQSLLEDDEDSEVVLIYFMTLKKHLTDCFIAARVVSSGIVERAPYTVVDKVKKLFSSLGNLLLGVGDFVGLSANEVTKLIGEGLRSGGAAMHITEFVAEALPESLHEFVNELLTSEDMRLHKVASVSSGEDYTMTGLEFTADAITLMLTYMYRPQIKCLTAKGAKHLAISGAERVMVIGKEGMVADSGDWIPKVIVLIGHPSLKQKTWRQIELETLPQYEGRWTENGVYCQSGIMCFHEGQYMFFGNTGCKLDKYDFRISGKRIAEECYGMQRLPNNAVSPQIKAAGKRYLSLPADKKLPRVRELDPEHLKRLRALEKSEKSLKAKFREMARDVKELKAKEEEEEIIDGGDMAMVQASSSATRHGQNGRTVFARQQEMEVVLAECVDAIAYLGREMHEMKESSKKDSQLPENN